MNKKLVKNESINQKMQEGSNIKTVLTVFYIVYEKLVKLFQAVW